MGKAVMMVMMLMEIDDGADEVMMGPRHRESREQGEKREAERREVQNPRRKKHA